MKHIFRKDSYESNLVTAIKAAVITVVLMTVILNVENIFSLLSELVK